MERMNPDYKPHLEKARSEKKRHRALLNRLKKSPPKDLDATVHALHEEAFSNIDCLQCANCCATTSPRFTGKDIERLARHLRMKPGAFIEQYLVIDEEGDYVFPAAPCPFLGADNYCSVYEARPQACRAYPHTDRRKFHQALGVTDANTRICPAVAQIVDQLHTVYP